MVVVHCAECDEEFVSREQHSKVYNETWALDDKCPVCKHGEVVKVTMYLVAPSVHVAKVRDIACTDIIQEQMAEEWGDCRFLKVDYEGVK